MPKKLVAEKMEEFDTQKLAEESKPEPKGTLNAYADFEFRRKSYKAGDKFTIPEDMKIDLTFTEFRGSNKRGKEQRGTAFIYSVITSSKDPMGGKVEDTREYREVLPVE